MNAAGFAAVLAERVAPREAGCAFCRRQRCRTVRLVVCGAAAICSECLGAALASLRAEIASEALDRERRAETPAAPGPRANGHSPPLTRAAAYTGEMCDFCFNFRMIRTGTCSTCLDCGGSSGCS